MALDPQFLIAPSLEQYFVDKTTGLPLAAGKVYFYSDVNRSNFKDVFKLSGSPPNYSYVALPNPSTLSAVGTFQDAGGNNILPYYYPYNEDGELENYYIEVFSADDVEQFTREAFPNAGGDDSDVTLANAINYIPNGQFLLHNNLPADILNDKPAGRVVSDITTIAHGGWTFERSTGSTAVDNLTFPSYGEFVENPSTSPRYACQISCTTPDILTTDKGLRVKFKDVNKFSAIPNRIYTIAFNATTFNSGNFVATLKLIKFFGTGGTPTATEVIPLTTFNITSNEELFQHSFTFGNNDGTNLGTNNDDYVQIELSFPTNISFGITTTNFMLLAGEIIVQSFPQTTDRDFITRSLPDLVPSHDGSDFALPVMVGKNGFYYDHGVVGSVRSSLATTMDGYFLCDGSQYLTSGYTSTGVPNSRLQTFLYDDGFNIPLFGTGKFFFTAIGSPIDHMTLHNNSAGTVTAISDGTNPTGFIFSIIHVGASSYGVKSFWDGDGVASGGFVIWNLSPGVVTAVSVGTTGFSIFNQYTRTGTTLLNEITTVATAGHSPLAGTYFTFNTPITGFYLWYKVDGVGADPAVGGRTGILVNLLSTDDNGSIAYKTSCGLNAFETTHVTALAGSAIPASSFFNVHTFGGTNTYYYVWYKKDGIGTDPKPVGGVGIQVDILTADTVGTIRGKTIIAINKFYFGVPDYRGQFLRGFDPLQTYDKGPRYSLVRDDYSGNFIGTNQLDEILTHRHLYDSPIGAAHAATGVDVSAGIEEKLTREEGGKESRPYNSSVNFFIKY